MARLRRAPHFAPLVRHALVALALAIAAVPAAAQDPTPPVVTERPVAFDEGQRVFAITPPLAERLRLAAPAWPVTGAYREARLFSSGATFTLVVARTDGTFDRLPLDAAAADALRQAVSEAHARRGSPSAEPGSDVLSEPAGFAFARNQLLVGLFVYGPTMAALVAENDEDGSTAAGTYLLSAGAPFFLALARNRGEPVTRAQNHLATDGGPRLALITSAAWYAATGDRDRTAYQGAVLAGAIGGTVAGLKMGRGLTDGEAQAMTATSTWATALTAGALGTMGRFDERCRTKTGTTIEWQTGQPVSYPYEECDPRFGRADYGVLAAAALAGYPLGAVWVRRAGYAVTAGDVKATFASGLVGMAAAGTLLPSDAERRTASAVLTAGLVGGVLVGDRLIARRFDYTRGQGTLLGVGAIGGALLGLVPPTLAQADEGRAYAVAATLGGIAGMWATHRLMEPLHANTGRSFRESRLKGGRRDRSASRGMRIAPGEPEASRVPDASRVAPVAEPRVQWQLDPAGLAMAAARAPGRHGILSITF